MNASNNPFDIGPITLFGSGETLPASGKAYEFTARALKEQPHIAIVETPAGFQPNSETVARKIDEYLSSRLQNYDPAIRLIPARKKGGKFSTNDPHILEPILSSNWIFIGPGSPTYAVKNIIDSKLLKYLYALLYAGRALTLSSAAVLAISTFTLPVYEIYKVGEKLHWVPGLDLFDPFGLNAVFIPHWNNNSGGDELDTRRCYMGLDRFTDLLQLLPASLPIIGIDEQTALIITLSDQIKWKITGIGNVTVKRGAEVIQISAGEYKPAEFGLEFSFPTGLTDDLLDLMEIIENNQRDDPSPPPQNVIDLADKRLKVRQSNQWDIADELRDQILSLGWDIDDTKDGYQLEKISTEN